MDELKKSEQQTLVALMQELQSPLTHIANQNSLTNQSNLEESVKIIEQQTNQMLKTIDNLISSFRHRLVDISTFDIRKIIQQVIMELDFQISLRKQEIIVKSRQRVATVATDSLMAHHILYNLIDNASRTSPDESTITISIRVSENHISVLVRDQAIQVGKRDYDRASMHLGKIAQPIPQQPENTGLRIYVASMLATKIAGSVNYAPAREGNCFVLLIPANEQLRLF